MNESMKEYNKLLKRHDAGAQYLDDNNIPIPEREKKVPAFRDIISKMNVLVSTIQKAGINVTDDEMLNGFVLENSKG